MRITLAISAILFLFISLLFFSSGLYTSGSIFFLTSAVSLVGSSIIDEIKLSVMKLKGELK